jgi:hypothetical protein
MINFGPSPLYAVQKYSIRMHQMIKSIDSSTLNKDQYRTQFIRKYCIYSTENMQQSCRGINTIVSMRKAMTLGFHENLKFSEVLVMILLMNLNSPFYKTMKILPLFVCSVSEQLLSEL